MAKFADQLADTAMGGLNSAIGAGMGLILGGINDRRQLKQQDKLNKQQEEMAKRMGQFNYDKQLEMWKATNYSAQLAEMKKAGLSTGLMYGGGGAGGATVGSQNSSAGGASAPVGGGEAMAGMGMALQMGLMKAQKENIEADTKEKLTKAGFLGGAQTNNVNADTENKVLSGVILKYAGKEAQETFEQVKSPNRGIEADTYQKELEARGGVAHNVWELWTEGKLKEKSNAEIEQLLLNNAKTSAETRNVIKTFDLIEANIKGAKISNIIGELEAEMQTQLGLDKGSPGWLKMFGRLFLGLGGKDLLNSIK